VLIETTIKPWSSLPDDCPGLVAIMNDRTDFRKAQVENWYRIPIRSAPENLEACRWIAFYLTATFEPGKWTVQTWAEILGITRVQRAALLPEQADHPRALDWYYRLTLGPLQTRPEPIYSRRRRRLVFIPSVWRKFVNALELNDLHHGSPLEDRLWAAFKQEGIDAERQWFEGADDRLYCLDFALFCSERNINVECDGDRWHSNPQQAFLDNVRNNFLEQRGWHVLRFNNAQLNQRLPECLQDIRNTIQSCGGLHAPEQPVPQSPVKVEIHSLEKEIPARTTSVKTIRREYNQAYRPWSAEDDAYLWSRFLEGATIDDLVQEFARQPGGIRARLRKLGLKLQEDTNGGEKSEDLPATATQGSASSHWRQLRPNAGRQWTSSDDEVLLREWEAATPLEEIAKMLGRGVHGVEVRLHKLGRPPASGNPRSKRD
jgi:very-short-patch-repair endonuclease